MLRDELAWDTSMPSPVSYTFQEKHDHVIFFFQENAPTNSLWENIVSSLSTKPAIASTVFSPCP